MNQWLVHMGKTKTKANDSILGAVGKMSLELAICEIYAAKPTERTIEVITPWVAANGLHPEDMDFASGPGRSGELEDAYKASDQKQFFGRVSEFLIERIAVTLKEDAVRADEFHMLEAMSLDIAYMKHEVTTRIFSDKTSEFKPLSRE